MARPPRHWDLAASRFGVYRHTLRNRMGKVDALLVHSLDQPGVRAELWLALQVLDRVPGHERSTIGIGGDHAAKFGSLLGRILADLATEGHTNYPIAPFSAVRPALTDLNFTPTFRLVG